ncbi:hypothetical protein HMPREF1624_06933 [Sporothrix schenckii ATCC 58251]|uniref:Uncharacterized protein n=1 Tax=Sporothrix schenckii (strain ATCC 58251 / de Perez 2211183) TaxID=1391915 RepID=U7PPP8_SPOS1|nr:hypothetical protein HMPREF1624_06933 [Sporothrix schenckii ATCC 58251]
MALDRRFTTRDVPAKFLEAVFLTGRVPWRVAPADPRVAYGLYVPPSQYHAKYTADAADDDQTDTADDRLPLVVWVHGTGRDTSPLSTELAAFAEANGCAVLAPFFPANMDGPHDLDAYKVLRSQTLRSDRVLLAILDEVAVVWPGIATETVYLGGFSGGGQFAHRFLYLYPERLAAVGVGAPGRATRLDDAQNWPDGIKDVEAVFGRAVDRAAVARVAIQIAVGSEDSAVHGGPAFWEWLRAMKAKEAAAAAAVTKAGQDKGGEKASTLPTSFGSRLDLATELHRLWAADGIASTLTVVPGFAHDNAGVRPHILEFLRSRLAADRKQ